MQIEEGVDQDGDPIVNVKVIFDGGRKRLDGRKVAGFVRHLRANLRDIGERSDAFPVMSFIAKSDWRKPTTEAG